MVFQLSVVVCISCWSSVVIVCLCGCVCVCSCLSLGHCASLFVCLCLSSVQILFSCTLWTSRSLSHQQGWMWKEIMIILTDQSNFIHTEPFKQIKLQSKVLFRNIKWSFFLLTKELWNEPLHKTQTIKSKEWRGVDTMRVCRLQKGIWRKQKGLRD